jgi:hypothetical protein
VRHAPRQGRAFRAQESQQPLNKKPAVSHGFFVSRVVASAALQDQTCIAFATSAA